MKRIVLLIAVLLAVSCVSQRGAAQGVADDGGARHAARAADRAALIARIQDLKHQKLVAALGLDAASSEKFFALYKPAETDIAAMVRERNEAVRKIAETDNKPDANVDAEISTVKDLNTKIQSREQQLDNDLKGVLSASQRGKLLVFEHEFNQRVRQDIARKQAAHQVDRGLRQQLRQQRIKERLLRKAIQDRQHK